MRATRRSCLPGTGSPGRRAANRTRPARATIRTRLRFAGKIRCDMMKKSCVDTVFLGNRRLREAMMKSYPFAAEVTIARRTPLDSRSGQRIGSGSVQRLKVTELGKNLALQDAFEVFQGAGDGAAVQHAMIVNDPHVDGPIRLNHPVMKGSGQGCQRVKRSGTEAAIHADTKGSQVMGALPAP